MPWRIKRAAALALQNYRLGLLGAGVYLVWMGLEAWSRPLATIMLGIFCIALALVRSLRVRKEP